ncbi:hypothetical protein [Chitinilyticum aquatile]|uniref:hypothetical protein n=1 Tax=Chitinilyticum aquatile TaxID=362520 RepID=UPI0003F972C3|nr:hypothetical protein [Chitinilyticum aquatile]
MSVGPEVITQRSIIGALLQGVVAFGITLVITDLVQKGGLGVLYLGPVVLIFAAIVHAVLLLIGVFRRHRVLYHLLPPGVIYAVGMVFVLQADIRAHAEADASHDAYVLNPVVNIQFLNLGGQPLGYRDGGTQPVAPIAELGRFVIYSEEAVWGTDGKYRPSFHFRSDGVPLLKNGVWNDEAKTIDVCELDTSGGCHYRRWPVSRIATPELDRQLAGKTAEASDSDYLLFFLNGRAEVVRRIKSPGGASTMVQVRNFTGKLITRVMLGDYVSSSNEVIGLTPAQGGLCGEDRDSSQYISLPGALPASLPVSWRESGDPDQLFRTTLAVPAISGSLAKQLQETGSDYFWELLLYPDYSRLRLVNRNERNAQCAPVWEAEPCACNKASPQPEIVLALLEKRLPLIMRPEALAAAIKEGEAASAPAADAAEQPQQ